jgi:hypothetical protein
VLIMEKLSFFYKVFGAQAPAVFHQTVTASTTQVGRF